MAFVSPSGWILPANVTADCRKRARNDKCPSSAAGLCPACRGQESQPPTLLPHQVARNAHGERVDNLPDLG